MDIRVLIVDDIEENRRLLRDILVEEFELKIFNAESGEHAIEIAKDNAFDILLIDMMLEMDGFQTATEIKNIPHNSKASVIFITADKNAISSPQIAFEYGALDFIQKPIDQNKLTSLLALYIRFIKEKKEYLEQLEQANQILKDEVDSRKDIETQLVKNQDIFKNIVGKSNAAILVIDKKGVLRFINNAGEIIFGRQASELIGEPFGLINESEAKSEIRIIRKNGEIGTGEITSTGIYWENKQAWLVLINDITEHKVLQQNLERAKEKAQESDRLKTAFLSNMSHEIRTPMNGIIGFVELLYNDSNLDEDQKREYLGIIRTSSNHLLCLINDIVDLSKIEAGQLPINLANCDINKLMLDLHALFSSNEKVLKKEVMLEIDVPVNEPSFKTITDCHRFRQILINLLGNAFKFTETGVIKFGYRVEDKHNIIFFVADTGKGIPKDKLGVIFDRFVQVDEGSNNLIRGTGLGLAITKSLLQLLGGDIWVESEINEGTKFSFTLPFTKPKEEYVTGELSQINEDRTKPLKSNASLHVLIAEDDDINFLLLSKILLDKQAFVERVFNGKQAVEYCRKHEPDLVLMDMKMPRMDGFEATQEIRSFNQRVPIIAQTAFALESEKRKCLEAGCSDYISKPINQCVLLNLVDKYFH